MGVILTLITWTQSRGGIISKEEIGMRYTKGGPWAGKSVAVRPLGPAGSQSHGSTVKWSRSHMPVGAACFLHFQGFGQMMISPNTSFLMCPEERKLVSSWRFLKIRKHVNINYRTSVTFKVISIGDIVTFKTISNRNIHKYPNSWLPEGIVLSFSVLSLLRLCWLFSLHRLNAHANTHIHTHTQLSPKNGSRIEHRK